MLFSLEYFWSSIVFISDIIYAVNRTLITCPTTKVSNFDIKIFIQKNVVFFEILVKDSILMQTLNTIHQLFEKESN